MTDPESLSVAIGFPCGPQIPYQTALALASTAKMCAALGIREQVLATAGSSLVTTARDGVLTQFLDSDYSRLFWIDSDIIWHPADFLRLVQLTAELDVVCGAYPLKRPDNKVVINGAKEPYTTNEYGLVKIESLGLGFTCVAREVVERWAASKPRTADKVTGKELVRAFRVDDNGEDVNFFNEIRALGYEVWLDPTVALGHVGTAVFQRDIAEALGLQITQE